MRGVKTVPPSRCQAFPVPSIKPECGEERTHTFAKVDKQVEVKQVEGKQVEGNRRLDLHGQEIL